MKLLPSKGSNPKSSPSRGDAKLIIVWNRLVTGRRKKPKAGRSRKNRPSLMIRAAAPVPPPTTEAAGNDGTTAVPRRTAPAKKDEPVLMLAERARIDDARARRRCGRKDPAPGRDDRAPPPSRPSSLPGGTTTSSRAGIDRPPRTAPDRLRANRWGRRHSQALRSRNERANHRRSIEGSGRAPACCTAVAAAASLFRGDEEDEATSDDTLDDTLDGTLEDTLGTFSSASDTLFDGTATVADDGRLPPCSGDAEVSLFLCGKFLDQVGLRSPDDSKEEREAWDDLIVDLLLLE